MALKVKEGKMTGKFVEKIETTKKALDKIFIDFREEVRENSGGKHDSEANSSALSVYSDFHGPLHDNLRIPLAVAADLEREYAEAGEVDKLKIAEEFDNYMNRTLKCMVENFHEILAFYITNYDPEEDPEKHPAIKQLLEHLKHGVGFDQTALKILR